MKSKTFWAAAGKALAVVTVTLIAVLFLAPTAGAANKYKVLYQFTGGTDGDEAWGDLVFDSAGNLYGTTRWGGDYGLGTVYKLSPNLDGSWTQTVLHSFAGGDDGAVTVAGLVFDTAGSLYGVTYNGGGGQCFGLVSGCGVVFKLTPNSDGSWTESILHSFQGTDGEFPAADLNFDSAGNLYGATQAGGGKGSCPYDGCGTVFQLIPNGDGSWTEKVLHSFAGDKDGRMPERIRLIFDTAGNLYGTTEWGGFTGCDLGCGLVFKLTPNADGSWTKKVLHYFTGTDGGWLDGNLVFDADGTLYGTTWLAGAYGYGTVYRLKPRSGGGWTFRVLHHFQGGKDGANSFAGLVFDAAGNLYGTTTNGGAFGYGTVFKLTRTPNGTWKERVVHTFAARPAAFPNAKLILDDAGNLYGTTTHNNNSGTYAGAAVVFEITP